MPDIGADTMYANATEKGTIDTIPEIPGLAVWHEGHIGIYIGGGKVIEAMGGIDAFMPPDKKYFEMERFEQTYETMLRKNPIGLPSSTTGQRQITE